MLFKALSLLVVIGSALAGIPSEARIKTETTLLDMMMQPRGDPVLDAYCWSRYTPIMKEIIDVFEAESKQCQTDFDISNTAIIAKYSIILANVTATAKESCDALLKCDDLSTQLEAFNCFGTAGRDQSQKLTTMLQQLSALQRKSAALPVFKICALRRRSHAIVMTIVKL
ncbi:uncharacterized protein LOC132787164 [Drosophila nasuta]|uniref:uncharacterized protein LOC132787164 n=1 Tax=Drosophila nasuta TaxID=42062 RepID=UPI00295E5091|nr:uncharacterized protein LOC132787164 [Drosophila nasuta]